MKKLLVGLAVAAACAAAGMHWYYADRGRFTTDPVYTGLERKVRGNTIVSARDPAVTLRFDPAYEYAGGQKFVLYGVADVEQHFFVETTPAGELQSVYWIQFEGYLPDNDYAYDYDDSPLRLTLGDLEFYADTTPAESDPDRKRARGTDGAMARTLLASKGYEFPRHFAYARLVHLTDETQRKELMIIFVDDLARYGYTAPELKQGGVKAGDWSAVEAAHLDRIRATLEVLPPAREE